MEVAKSPEVIRAYRNRNSLLTYPIGLINKGFALLLIFSSASILSDLDTLLDVLLGRRSHNDAIIVFKTRFLFQLDRNKVANWVH
jgi:hypothetical protein